MAADSQGVTSFYKGKKFSYPVLREIVGISLNRIHKFVNEMIEEKWEMQDDWFHQGFDSEGICPSMLEIAHYIQECLSPTIEDEDYALHIGLNVYAIIEASVHALFSIRPKKLFNSGDIAIYINNAIDYHILNENLGLLRSLIELPVEWEQFISDINADLDKME